MKKLKVALAFSIAFPAFWYLLFSFALWSLNPYDWGFGGRYLYSILAVGSEAAVIVYYFNRG